MQHQESLVSLLKRLPRMYKVTCDSGYHTYANDDFEETERVRKSIEENGCHLCEMQYWLKGEGDTSNESNQ